MSNDDTTIKAVLTSDGRVLIEQPDGSFRAAAARTDWQRVNAMTEEEIERNAAEEMAELGIDPDGPDHARLVFPRPKARITMRLDSEVIGFFKAQGKGYQSRMQAVLRAYVEAHRGQA
jgi:uncharacterized protein (DUF4415 family)